MLALIAALTLAYASSLLAQAPGGGAPSGPIVVDSSIKTTYVRLGGARGLVYEPVKPGEKSHIGVFVMHDSADYTTFNACTELSKRGYTVLCAANSAGNIPGSLDRIILDAKSSVTYLRNYPGVQKVVLFGHSGGATLMTAYQMIAENGIKSCQGPEKIWKCPANLAGMPAADGMLLADANWGVAEMTLFSIDPAIIDERTGQRVNPELDLFNARNGFNPAGSHYSEEFIRKFQIAEGKRETTLIKTAEARYAAINAGNGLYTDDEPFDIPGANTFAGNNKLYPEDTRLMSHTRKAWPLLLPDGKSVTQIVHSVRPSMGPKSGTPTLGMGALRTTVRGFLSTFAIRVTDDYGYGEDSVRGVDWASTYASPPGNIQGITIPFLALGMTGSWEYLASETIYENAKSADKTLAFVAGATHNYTTCKQCEKTPGEYGDTIKTLYDYADGWLSKPGRFMAAPTSDRRM
jgi:hypothetical protein